MNRKVEISHRTVIFIAVFLILLWFLFQIKDIILTIFIAFILMAAFHPAVDRLEKVKVPRALAILISYAFFWSLIAAIIAGVVPGVIDQSMKLIHTLPDAVRKLDIVALNQEAINNQFLYRVGSLPENILRVTVGVFGNVINVLTTIVISFYLLLERKKFSVHLARVFDEYRADQMGKLITNIERRLGSWIRGELVLMLSVGLLTYIGLTILGVDSALPLAVLAGFLEIIPNIGPIVSAIPAVIVAFAIHPFLALSTAALYFLVQFLENHILVPKIMQTAVGVNPLISIIALMIGFKLSGATGAILALPTIIIIDSIIKEFPPYAMLRKFLA